MSIGQIAADIYNTAQTLPVTNSYYEYVNSHISTNNLSVSFTDMLANATSTSNATTFTMPTTFQAPVSNPYYDSNYNYITTSYEYAYAFPTSTTQSDILVLPASSSSLTITDISGSSYYGTISYAYTGDDSGHNTVDVSYQASGGTGLTNYLLNAANFQTLDFNYSGSTDYNSLNLNLNLINSGFTNFVMDNSGFDNSFTFSNAINNDNFVVMSSVNSLSVSDSTNNTNLNIIMDGNISIGSYDNSALTFNGQTINIDSTGSAGNSIGGIDFSNNNTISNMTLNITGSESLIIGGYEYYINYGIYLNDGSTLNVNDNSAGNLTIYVGDNSNSTSPSGVILNFAESTAPMTIYDISSNNTPDTIILGSGATTVNTDNGNTTITLGSGVDSVVTNAYVTTYYGWNLPVTSSSYSGYIATLGGNINANDSITFTNITSNSVNIAPSLISIDESSATSQTAAIANAIDTLANNLIKYGGTPDELIYFTYGGNTYLINGCYAPSGDFEQNQVVKLIGNVSLTNVTISGHTISNL